MIRALLFPVALSVTLPAMAQDMTSPVAPAEPQAAPASPASPASPADSVAGIVDSEFPAYDGNNDKLLDKAEFARWMVALKDQEMKTTGQKMAPEEVTAWTDGAFRTADADKSTSITKMELITYLNGGAR